MGSASVAVVTPTRNRPESLSRLLRSLEGQYRLPDEVILVDASEPPLDPTILQREHPKLQLHYLPMQPSVCAQRNAGIRQARCSHILLCDDDMELPPNYVQDLLDFLESHPQAGCVTGVLLEPSGGEPVPSPFAPPSPTHVLYAFLFQLSLAGDLEAVGNSGWSSLALRLVRRWYRRRGNKCSLAGWPLLTQVRGPIVRTSVYGLGAALVRRDWLLSSPYDEALGPHGIGDNYGVALGFPQERPIWILPEIKVLHHRAPDNRLPVPRAYYFRVIALERFLRDDPRFSFLNRAFLAWSLIGSAALFLARRNLPLLLAALRALGVVVTGRNPLRDRSPRALLRGGAP